MSFFDQIVARWKDEFGRAVEMFTGDKASLSSAALDPNLTESLIDSLTWWKQVVRAEDSFSIWVGAPESVWTALEGQTTYFEVLGQANQGTLAVLSASFAQPLQCEPGLREAPRLPLDVEAIEIKLAFRNAEAGNIILLFEKSGIEVLRADTQTSALMLRSSDESPSALLASPILSRLMDLQLPVSVLLGRATITIKQALKLIPGSVVELDRQVGDQVEVLVHGTIVARGEIVSVKGNYGVRIKEVISRQDRIALQGAA